jgi:hypothetical protein
VNSPPPKPEVILTNLFAKPTVLLVPITSRDTNICTMYMKTNVFLENDTAYLVCKWFCKQIREDNFRFWWRRVHEDASQGMYMSKIEFAFSLLEYCKIRECYAVAKAFTIRNMYSLLLYTSSWKMTQLTWFANGFEFLNIR